MWTNKPVNEWAEEEKNHFLTSLMGKCWHKWEWTLEGLIAKCNICGEFRNFNHVYKSERTAQLTFPNADYFTDSGFAPVKRFMEEELPKVWEDYLLDYTAAAIVQKWAIRQVEGNEFSLVLNAQINLSNLIQYLLDNQEEWVWCDAPHPALIYAESLKEV